MLCVLLRIGSFSDSNEYTQHSFSLIYILKKIEKMTICIIPLGLALLSVTIGSNYPCLEQIFIVQKVFEPSKFLCILLV